MLSTFLSPSSTIASTALRRLHTITRSFASTSNSFTKEIDLYYAPTPNGYKVEIALEELSIPYKIHNINISKGDQFTPEFLKINPNNKIPAIVDHNQLDHEGKPLSIFESGAILIYLAQKTGELLLDAKTDPAGNAEVIQWVMWQMAGWSLEGL